MSKDRYPVETLSEDDDDGTMPDNVSELRQAVVGHRIVRVEKGGVPASVWTDRTTEGLVITLDDGRRVQMADTDDCCAYTELESFLLNVDKIDHVITGVGTTGEYTTWHVYADMGDVLQLKVGWSPGNPFYYAYGFHISVVEAVS